MPDVILTQIQAATLADLSLRHFARLLKEPGAPPLLANAEGRASGIPARPFRVWLRNRIARELGAGDSLSPQAERARLDARRADLAEVELAKRRGELVPIEEVAAVWSERVAVAKGRLLSLPSRVSAQVLRMKSQREIENAIKAAVVEVLQELSDEAKNYGDDPA